MLFFQRGKVVVKCFLRHRCKDFVSSSLVGGIRNMASKRLSPGDPSSHSRPEQAVVTRMHLDLTVEFEKKILHGSVVMGVKKVDRSAQLLKLDCSNLNIAAVSDVYSGKSLEWSVGEMSPCGAEFSISLPDKEDCEICVNYSTSPSCSALQWMSPAQTGGDHPFMFSQNQAIHCRAMVPCQDTPSVKTTYTSTITVSSPLVVLMSALREEPVKLDDNLLQYKFSQPVPVQSYLIAIAVGSLESVRVGPRSLVWGNKKQLELAKIDFSETEQMLKCAEELCGPYVWGVYDILVLPPSFPFGGMENPCLTFVTPTLLSGDKSNANVIAHEIAHSWTGNLVTNSNFEHFWLNEGFTVFTERKILGRMRGEATRHFAAILGWRELEECVHDEFNPTHPFTALVPDLSGVDPDDAFSTIPYEKGSTFLWYLEELVGGSDQFETFLRAYYEEFKYKSIETEQFKSFFLQYFSGHSSLKSIEWNTWFFAPGMPPYKPDFNSVLAQKSQSLASKWLDGSVSLCVEVEDFQQFTAEQKLEFLGIIFDCEKVDHSMLENMDKMYNLSKNPNTEILFLFLRIGIKSRWPKSVDLALDLAVRQGRMKFCRPLFRDLWAWHDEREKVKRCYLENKDKMMAVCREMVGKDLGVVKE